MPQTRQLFARFARSPRTAAFLCALVLVLVCCDDPGNSYPADGRLDSLRETDPAIRDQSESHEADIFDQPPTDQLISDSERIDGTMDSVIPGDQTSDDPSDNGGVLDAPLDVPQDPPLDLQVTDLLDSDLGSPDESVDDSNEVDDAPDAPDEPEAFSCESADDELNTPPDSEGGGRLFTTESGYRLFFNVDSLTSYVELDLHGMPVGPSEPVGDDLLWRTMASNGNVYAALVKSREGDGWRGAIRIAEATDEFGLSILGSATIPRDGPNHGGFAIAWNSSDAEWGVVWEEGQGLLYFGRVSASGEWIDGSRRLLTPSAPDIRGYLFWTDFTTTAMIWHDDRYALVWREVADVPSDGNVYLVELDADGIATQTQIDEGAFTGGWLAWDGTGYGIAWKVLERPLEPDRHSAVRFRYVTDTAMSDIVSVGDEVLSTHSYPIAFDGERFTVPYTEAFNNNSTISFSRLYYARIDPETLHVDTVPISGEDYMGHDWAVGSLVHDGCRHALAFVRGMNPSDGMIALFK